MFSRRLRNYRLFYLLCIAFLVVAMSGTGKAAYASGVSITLTGITVVSTSCTPTLAEKSLLANYTVNVNVPNGFQLKLRVSVTAPGATSPSDGASSLFGGGTINGPFSGSAPSSAGRRLGILAPNTIMTITYYNSLGSGSGSVQVNCSTGAIVGGPSSAFNITHFDPADGRIDGQPGDRLVIYCNPTANPPSIDIYGISDDGLGFLLGRFKFSLVVRSVNRGVVLRPVGKGKISLQVDANNNFYAAWNGGPFSANGAGIFAKSFTCPFKR